jgi:hypothetical protein
MMKCVFSVLFLVSLIRVEAISQNIGGIDSSRTIYPEVTIPNTELRTLHSEIMNQDLNIYIKLPTSYYTTGEHIYPVWYFTDANRSFPLVANISSVLEIPKTDFPEIVIVGIGYKIKDMADWGAWRTRDLTPTNVPKVDKNWEELLAKMSGRTFEVRSGSASKFLEFIIKELIPFMESNYRVSTSDRGLGGYSYGGLFTLFALFKYPEKFIRYFAGSPSLEYDNRILFQYENEFASTHTNLNAKIFMCVGGNEDSTTKENMKRMADRLKSRNYQGLQLESNVFPDEDHRSCIPSAIMRAFKLLYKP